MAYVIYAELPDGVCDLAFKAQVDECLYTYLSKPFIDSLTVFLADKNVLEVYAGRGHLSALLRERGVPVRATSLRSGHDGSYQLGHVTEVEDLGVKEAVQLYRDWLDVLLVCWPVADESLANALYLLPAHATIVFVGEVTDYQRLPRPFLGGCASDAFFERVESQPELEALLMYPTPRVDQVKVYKRRPAAS